MEYMIESIEELHIWAGKLLITLEKKDSATIIALLGDVGVGKTTLVQQFAQHLGITESITSPTFVIQKEYEVVAHPWVTKLVHIDAYRLEGRTELEYLGWKDLIKNPETLIIMEWPEMVEGISLPEATKISLTINADHNRTLKTSFNYSIE